MTAETLSPTSSPLEIYISSTSGNLQIKKHQSRILDLLTMKQISYSVVDVAAPEETDKKELMKERLGPAFALPYIFKGGLPFWTYGQFEEAVEDGLLGRLLD